MHEQTKMPAEEWRVRWTPDGVVLESWLDGARVASGTYADARAAVEGLLLLLNAAEEAYMFPGLTGNQIEVEKGGPRHREQARAAVVIASRSLNHSWPDHFSPSALIRVNELTGQRPRK